MQPLTNIWPETAPARGTKFFVQAFRAFLDIESFEGFRAYTLDTLARMREVSALAGDISKKRTSILSLKPVLDELVWSIEADEAALVIFPELMGLIKKAGRTQPIEPSHVARMADMAVHRLYPRYRAELRNWVTSLIDDDNRRVDLLKATGFLASHLVNDGHSRLYLIDAVERRFTEKTVKRAGSTVVAAFIDGITEGRRDYKVVGAITDASAKVLEQVGATGITTIEALPQHAQDVVCLWEPENLEQRFLTITANVADPFKAGEQIDSYLAKIKSQIIIGTRKSVIKWDSRCYVYTPRASSGIELIDNDASLLVGMSKVPKGRRARELTSIPKLITQNFESHNQDRLASAISTAAIAYEATADETKLISLWSATEVLLGDPPEDSARIKHFVEGLVPSICLRYQRRVFSAVHDQLAVGYRKSYTAILKHVSCDWSTNPHTKLIRLVTLPQYNAERIALCNMCASNPLALHRLFRLEKLFSTPKACSKAIKEHFDRVSWHVHRIYRARNDLVHMGKPSPHLDDLVLNASEYFRMAAITIIKRASHSVMPASIDRVVAEIGFEWLIQINRLEAHGSSPFDDGLVRATFAAL